MHILIVRNNSNAGATDASLMLSAYLASQSLDFTVVDSSELSHGAPSEKIDAAMAAGCELAIVLGGDGTILRTARYVNPHGTPILGMNFGRLGFLANPADDSIVATVASALAGELAMERRANLRIDVVCEGERNPWDDDAEPGPGEDDGSGRRSFFALNELAITRGANGRVIDFSLDIAGAHIADMRGDGLVVATATGSTAYALSAGGPLVAPGFSGLVVVPLAPHTLHSRAIVTAESDVVEVALTSDATMRETSLFADGELLSFERPPTHLTVRRGERPTILLRAGREGFYEYASRVFF